MVDAGVLSVGSASKQLSISTGSIHRLETNTNVFRSCISGELCEVIETLEMHSIDCSMGTIQLLKFKPEKRVCCVEFLNYFHCMHIFVMYRGMQSMDLDIQTINFFLSPTELEIFCSCLMNCWLQPTLILNLGTGVAEEVEFAKDSIVHGFLP